jgi:hypothetical protein
VQNPGKSDFDTKSISRGNRALTLLAHFPVLWHIAHLSYGDGIFHNAFLTQALGLVLFRSGQRPDEPNQENYPFTVVAAPLGAAIG